jgi:YhcH/YjgK/YiaL family protein
MFSSNVICQNKDVTKWNDEQINDWFNSSIWVKDFSKKVDSSINKKEFVKQNVLNSKSWTAAYKFLKENDLVTMPVGKYDLADDGTYATVTDYLTKDADTAFFEAHRRYIDIQYVAKGKEFIRLTTLDLPLIIHQPYIDKKDIEFFSKKESKQLLATPEVFFVFFPSDAHMPCLKVKDNAFVRKIVVKIPYVK